MNNNYAIFYDGENTNFFELIEDGFDSYEQAREYFVDHNLNDDDYFIIEWKDIEK